MNARARWNVKTGATASGKTYVDYAYVIPKRIMSCKGKGLIFIIGNTRPSIEQNILSPMREIWGKRLVGNIQREKGTVRLFGKTVITLGADSAGQVSKIQGATIEYLYGDEITTWSRPVFEMCKSRLRTDRSCADVTCNPEGPQHWFKKFLEKPGIDLYRQNYILDDNEFLAKNVIDNIKLEYGGTVYYDRYVLGKWALAEGLIYQEFQRGVVDIVPDTDEYDQFQIAMDYGIYNPTVFLLFGHSRRDGVWYLIKEYVHSGKEGKTPKTDEEYYNDLCSFAGGLPINRLIIDPSASSFITLVRRRNRFRVRPADNAVLDGIRETNQVMHSGILKVSSVCKKTIEEAGLYSWDAKSTSLDKPIKENDHCMDALRYFVKTNRLVKVIPIWRNRHAETHQRLVV